jgi:ribose transport system ATP-binding protein
MTERSESGATLQTLYVRLSGITKSFGGVQALDGVDVDFSDGEIHGLLGENGSGKSTLIKILAGFHTPDKGEIFVRGKPVDLPMKPGAYRSLGFAFVHQDLGLVEQLSVLENVRMERFAAARKSVRISWRAEERITAELFERFHAPWISARTTVADLRPIDRALVAIVRALSNVELQEKDRTEKPGSLLVLDEPTAFLSRTEADQMFETLRHIAAAGTSVLFVSHKLHEVMDLTHRVTVLRDGRLAGTRLTHDVTEKDLIRMVLGRDQENTSPAQPAAPAPGPAGAPVTDEPLLSLRKLRISGRLSHMDLDVPKGQIVGLTGLEGSGFEEMLYALFGLCPHPVSGSVSLAGEAEELRRLTPERAMGLGVALVPGDRQTQGCVPSLTVRENLAAPVFDTFRSGMHLSWRRINAAARKLTEQFDIRPRDVDRDVAMLSGGNQQKVVLAKWLQTRPRLLLLHEPTQGVDIGAREQIFAFIRAATQEGRCTVVASTDYEQLEQLCTRVLVIGDGHVTADLRDREVNRDRIAKECLLSQRTVITGSGAKA